jgi:hypothetical protein
MPRDGSLILSDVRATDADDRLSAVRTARAVQCREADGGARGRQAHRPIADARQLPEGEVRQRLRSMQGRLRRACGVLALLIRHSHWGRGHTISISAEALAAIEATLPDGREAELWQDVRDLIHGKVEAWDASYEILRHSGAAGLR